MSAVEMEMTARLGKPEEASKFSRQHLANSLWALATLERLPSGRLLTALAGAMQERASDCNPQEISNTVWAFAKLGQPCSLLPCTCPPLPVPCPLLLVSCLPATICYVQLWAQGCTCRSIPECSWPLKFSQLLQLHQHLLAAA